MTVRLVDKAWADAQPGDLFRTTTPDLHILFCPGCGKAVNLPHFVEVHESGLVSLWGPAGRGAVPRSFLCPRCGFHKTIERGECL